MPAASSADILDELLQAEYRSFPRFLGEVRLRARSEDQAAVEALHAVAVQQGEAAGRIAALLDRRSCSWQSGCYPIEYTDTHLLALDGLLHELAERQQVHVAFVERCVQALRGDREARELAEEILGAERAHLESILALQHQAA